jgi:hypothetical protein
MGAILVHLGNANRRPLDDRADVHVVSTTNDATVAVARDVPGTAPIRLESLIERQMYLVKVFPKRHRPVAQFVMAGSDDQPTVARLFAPLHPEHVRAATFPEYTAVHDDLRRVLERSALDGIVGAGQALYAALTNTQKAGLFNLFAKMSGVRFDDGRSVWDCVDGLFDVRGDRIYADVQADLLDVVRGAAEAGRFRDVPSKLHDPPPGFGHAGSFKTGERHGNLQLTFFSSLAQPMTLKVDADIDDAAGLGHTFQVLRNFVTQGATHPYDIHQILVFRQDAALPYDLA